jgi:hypothetical protein
MLVWKAISKDVFRGYPCEHEEEHIKELLKTIRRAIKKSKLQETKLRNNNQTNYKKRWPNLIYCS